MSYVLMGSVTSPFVRRMRLLMEGIPHELKTMNIFEATDAQELHRVNPINQIPVLLDGGKPVWDSRIIFNHLNAKHSLLAMDLEKENRLTGIERALDAGITLFLMKRSGMDTTQPFMFVQRQKERIDSVLDWITPWASTEGARTWDFQSMSLYTALDWMGFREIHPVNRPALLEFMRAHAHRPSVQATDPRKG